MSTTYQLPRKASSPAASKKPSSASSRSPHTSLPLYNVIRLGGSYAVVTAQGGKVQMRGSKMFCKGWMEDNSFQENEEMA